MKMSKKTIIILLLLVCLLGAITVGRLKSEKQLSDVAKEEITVPEETPETQKEMPEPVSEIPGIDIQTPEPEPEPTPEPQPAEAAPVDCVVEANGYRLEVKSASIEKDYNGNDIAVVLLLFTNNNASEQQFFMIANDNAYQNGTALRKDVPVADSKFYNTTKAISSGQTIPIYLPYALNDPNAPVDFSISIYNFASGTQIAGNSCSLTLQ